MTDIDMAALRAAAENPIRMTTFGGEVQEWFAANPAVVLELLDRLAAAEGAVAGVRESIPQTLDAHAEDSGGLGCICGWWAPDDKDDASYDTHLARALLAAIGHTDSTRVVQMRDEAAIARALAAPPGVPHIPPSLRRANEREQP